MSGLRIAIVTNLYAPARGGCERTMNLVGGALAERGHDVTVLTRRYDSALRPREMQDAVAVERYGPTGRGVAAKWLLNVSTFRRLFRPSSFDCVLVTQFSATVFGPALARALGGPPFVISPIEHGEFTGDISVLSLARLPAGLRAGVQGALKAVRRWSYELARFVIAPSSALAREAEGFGFPRDAIHIVPNPVDTTRFRPAEPGQRAQLRQALGLSEESEVVVYTGRLVRGKGLLTLVAAWEQVAAARSRALLVLVGEGVSDSPLDAEEDIRRAVHSAGLQSRVRFEGNRDDVERYLQAGDLYAFPSEAEGFGNALVEALACGLAVVCSRIEGASADLVVEGQHGLKFEVSDAPALAARLLDLLADLPSRRRMGEAGRTLAERRMSVTAVTEAYECVLAKAAEHR